MFLQILVAICIYTKILNGCSTNFNGYFWLVGCWVIFFNVCFSALFELFIIRMNYFYKSSLKFYFKC